MFHLRRKDMSMEKPTGALIALNRSICFNKKKKRDDIVKL